MNCLECGKRYYPNDNDAGTFRERFCSKECEKKVEKGIEQYLELQRLNKEFRNT